MTEPWLRGPLEGVHPLIAPLFHCFQQVREDLELHTAGLSPDLIWSRPRGLAPLGFQLRHMAGSIDRLAAYLKGSALSEAQLAASTTEFEPGATRDELLQAIATAMSAAEQAAREAAADLTACREVGRLRLPTTAIGLIVHIAEHTQRHLGQAIVTARLLHS